MVVRIKEYLQDYTDNKQPQDSKLQHLSRIITTSKCRQGTKGRLSRKKRQKRRRKKKRLSGRSYSIDKLSRLNKLARCVSKENK